MPRLLPLLLASPILFVAGASLGADDAALRALKGHVPIAIAMLAIVIVAGVLAVQITLKNYGRRTTK